MKKLAILAVLPIGALAYAGTAGSGSVGIETALSVSTSNATVVGEGSYDDFGPDYDSARKNACKNAQIQCQNKSVNRVTDWEEYTHHVEGVFIITERANFTCLPESATEENLIACAKQ